MKKIIIIIISLVISILTVNAKTVATVDGQKITESMLLNKMTDYEDSDLSYNAIKKIALDILINEQLLFNHGKKENIDVDEYELDAFFINEFSNHSNFVVNGKFSDAKYQNFKFTTRGKKILAKMRKELLINKIRTLIIKDFNLTDKYLYQQYLIENTQIEINYAIIDIDKVNIPLHYSVDGAINYYKKNRDKILAEKLINLEFIYFPKDEFMQIATDFFVADSTSQDSISVILIESEADRLAKEKAELTLQKIRDNEDIDITILETGFLSKYDEFGIIDNDLIKNAFTVENSDFSKIFELNHGYISYRVKNIKQTANNELSDIKDEIWSAYINDEKVKNDRQYERVFIANLDDFIIPAAIVKKIIIGKPSFFSNQSTIEYQKELSTKIYTQLYDEKKLNNLIDKNNLQTINMPIYLDKIVNNSYEDKQIAIKINNDENSGIFKKEDKLIIYKTTLFFPEYIPKIEDVKPLLQELISGTDFSETDLEGYYNAHKKDFTTPDSLRLGICYFEKSLSNYVIDEEKLLEYYQDKKSYREKAITFKYIFSKDRERANLIHKYCLEKNDFFLLQKIYSEKCDLPSNEIIEYSKLPIQQSENLSNLAVNSFSEPIEYNDGWLIILKTEEHAAGIPPFKELRNSIEKDLIAEQAEILTYQKAKTVFDSTKYFSQAYKYVKSENIHKTELQNANEPFNYLGNITDHRKELLRIWANEKYSSIIDTGDGFAVVYLIKKQRSKQLNYEDAKKQVKQLLIAQKQTEKARSYTQRIMDRIKNNGNPVRTLFFLGGWKHKTIDSLEEDIFSSKFSNLIISDISSHQENYFSPIIKLENERYLFYQIEKMNKITFSEFKLHKKEFHQKIISVKLEKWFEKERNLSKIY